RSIRVQQVRLARLILEVRDEFLSAAGAMELHFAVDEAKLDRDLDIVFGHPELLRQVVTNLLDNAIKYSSPHSLIFIRSGRKKNGAFLEIMNRGLWIRHDASRKLFDRGYRAPGAKALVPHGTGLGLWLVREILRLHRAEIEHFERSKDKHFYNVFRITFPSAEISKSRKPTHGRETHSPDRG
ncbi:MAG: ATP-binding protein, partial [Holophagales bacterium]|nr:ATP-binding protein [Holophagales bacterium]